MQHHNLAPIEPGHQFEWAWLLTRWGKMAGRKDALIASRKLVEIGEKGVDETRGLAHNGLNFDLTLNDRAFRLWPQTERIKAWLMMAEMAITPEDREVAYAKVAEAARSLQRFSREFFPAFGWIVSTKMVPQLRSMRPPRLFITSSVLSKKCTDC